MDFRTHTGEIITGDRLQKSIESVADWMVDLAHKIRKEDAYAPHVSELQKDQLRDDYIEYAEQVRKGEHLHNFTIWQRVNNELTGECVAFLP